jgi:hypothetical protein
MPDELDAAIDDLYRAFARRPARAHVAGCPCCVRDEDHARLTARPLRELATADLSKLAWKALTTWGDEDDLARFLPRLLELLAREPGGWADEEILLGKLELGGWRAWPAGEVAAVTRYLHALWRATLATYPPRLDVTGLLRALSRLFDDLGPFIAAWDADASVAALCNLARLVTDHQASLWRTGALGGHGWRAPQGQQVAAWLRRPAIVERLERGFFAHAGAPFAAELSSAHEILSGVSPRPPGA